MPVSKHDPLRFASELSAKLATRSRHVCFLLGAGVARACGLPDVAQLQERVLEALAPNEKEALTAQLKGRNLEEALSRLRRIAALLTADQEIDGLTSLKSKALDALVCQAIVRALAIDAAELTPVCHLAAWIARAGYSSPVEIFTVNYDLLLETALERLRVPYFDGFVGNLRARFQTELVEAAPDSHDQAVPPFFARLWKLHGSVNWSWQDDREILRLGQPVEQGRVAAIYPSDTKYEESRRVPFLVLQDRFRRALHQPETILLISGYSFSDAHLNEIIFDAATRRARSEIVAFCFSRIPDMLSARASTTPNLQIVGTQEAIIGGVRAEWKPIENDPAAIWENGKLSFCDFGKLAGYLARSAAREPQSEALIRDMVQNVEHGVNDVGGANG